VQSKKVYKVIVLIKFMGFPDFHDDESYQRFRDDFLKKHGKPGQGDLSVYDQYMLLMGCARVVESTLEKLGEWQDKTLRSQTLY
jgi:hypothetical protein